MIADFFCGKKERKSEPVRGEQVEIPAIIPKR